MEPRDKFKVGEGGERDGRPRVQRHLQIKSIDLHGFLLNHKYLVRSRVRIYSQKCSQKAKQILP